MRQWFRPSAPTAAGVLSPWRDGARGPTLEAQLASLGPAEAFFVVWERAMELDRRIRRVTVFEVIAGVTAAIGTVVASEVFGVGGVVGMLPVVLGAIALGWGRHRLQQRLGRLLHSAISVFDALDDPNLLGPLLLLLVRVRWSTLSWGEVLEVVLAIRAACASVVRLIGASGRDVWLEDRERAVVATLVSDAATEHLESVRPMLFGNDFLVAVLLLAADLRLKEAAGKVYELPRGATNPLVQEAARIFLKANEPVVRIVGERR